MNDITCSEQDFYQQRQRYGQLSFVIIFLVFLGHVLLFAGTFILPSFFESKPAIYEIMTIDLVSVSEPAPAISRENLPETEPVFEPENIAPVVPEPPSVEAVAVEPVAEAVQEPVVTAKPISLTPLKRKEQVAVDTRLEEEKILADQKQIEERMRNLRAEVDLRKRQQEERQRFAEQKKREEEARKREVVRAKALEQQARDEAEIARQKLARFHQIRESASVGGGEREGRRASNNQTVSNALLNQYTANLHAMIEQYWQLPRMRQWPDNIETIVEFTVHKDGSITGLRISSSSGYPFFDRFARETVKKAVPLPPIPVALRKMSIDYGLVFDQSGIQ